MKRRLKEMGLVLFCMLVFAPVALAHKVTIFAWAEGDTVYTQSKFSGGKWVKDGKVAVFDSDGALVLEGRTDDKGEFAFNVPAITDLTIVLTAGMGHQNSWKLTAEELGQGQTDSTKTEPSPSVPATSDIRQATIPPPASQDLTVQAIESIVARQLEQKLQPMTRMLVAAQDKGPTISEIVGGIGYIIGLVGLGAYVRYRKNGQRP